MWYKKFFMYCRFWGKEKVENLVCLNFWICVVLVVVVLCSNELVFVVWVFLFCCSDVILVMVFMKVYLVVCMLLVFSVKYLGFKIVFYKNVVI